jgi:glycosyltransferase involved in cell wall biosynthesis
VAEARVKAVVIPAYQEEARLPAVLAALASAAPGFRVIVIDDGSRDGTAAAARSRGATVLRHPFNLGYGAALQTGYKWALRAGATLLVQMDADGQHDPAELAALAAPVEAGELDLVIGSRFLGTGDYRMSRLQGIGRDFFRALLSAFGLRVTDPTSGFQAMNRAALELYASDMFPSDYPDVDVLLCAHRHGLRVGERPVRMHASPRASTLHAGLAPVYYVYKMLLSVWAASSTDRRRREGA